MPIFSNIARAEQRHMDLVQKLFEIYGLDLPTTLETEGTFDDPNLAAAYAEFIFQDKSVPAVAEFVYCCQRKVRSGPIRPEPECLFSFL